MCGISQGPLGMSIVWEDSSGNSSNIYDLPPRGYDPVAF